MRRLGGLLLTVDSNHHGPDRAVLDNWVAEARGVVCCMKAYNPEALKKLETSSLDPSAAVEPDLSPAFCSQQLASPSCTCLHSFMLSVHAHMQGNTCGVDIGNWGHTCVIISSKTCRCCLPLTCQPYTLRFWTFCHWLNCPCTPVTHKTQQDTCILGRLACSYAAST